MSENILNNIITKKIERIDFLKKTTNLVSLDKIIDKNNSYIDFKKKIQNNITQDKISIIAEIKKASPSAGVIIDNYNPVEIAKIYNDNKVTSLSVLTEEDLPGPTPLRRRASTGCRSASRTSAPRCRPPSTGSSRSTPRGGWSRICAGRASGRSTSIWSMACRTRPRRGCPTPWIRRSRFGRTGWRCSAMPICRSGSAISG